MDTDLVTRAQGGDQEALADLVYAIADRLLAVSHRILSDMGLAEDATQQALLSIWQNLPQLRDPARFEAWSYRLLVRACYAEGRKSRRWAPILRLLSIDEPMVVDGTSAVVDRDQLERAFRRLSVNHRTVVVLHHYLDLPLDRVADIVGAPLGTVGIETALRDAAAAVGAHRRRTAGGPGGGAMTDIQTSDRDVNRAIRSWLHEERHEDASRLAGAVLDQVDTIPQRRATWWPARRTPVMNKIVGFGLAAVAVVVVLIVGAQFVGSPGTGGVGAGPTATPEPTASPEPSPSPAASAPPLTQSFVSTLHGISLSGPEGWTAQAATEPWTDSTFPLEFGQPHADFLYDPTLTSDLFLTVASQPVGGSTSDDWVAEQMASDEGCTATESITVGGATGLIGDEGCHVAVVTTAGRGYWIQLYASSDDPTAVAPYDRAWFEEVLATVQLHPEDAVDQGP